jgi:hypothetical protein
LPAALARAKIEAAFIIGYASLKEALMAVASSPNVRRAASRSPRQKSTAKAPSPIDPEQRRAMIAQVAYFRAERRGFVPGYEAEDWLAAESEVDTALTLGAVSSSG